MSTRDAIAILIASLVLVGFTPASSAAETTTMVPTPAPLVVPAPRAPVAPPAPITPPAPIPEAISAPTTMALTTTEQPAAPLEAEFATTTSDSTTSEPPTSELPPEAVIAEPTTTEPTTTDPTTTAAPTTEAAITTDPTPTTSAAPAPETTGVPTTEVPTTETPTTEASETTTTDATTTETTTTETTTTTTPPPAGEITLTTSSITGTEAALSDRTVRLTFDVTVYDTRTSGAGWTASARVSNLVGERDGATLPSSITYSSPSSICSASTGTQILTEGSVVVQQADKPCSASWTVTVTLELPEGVDVADVYMATVEHSLAPIEAPTAVPAEAA